MKLKNGTELTIGLLHEMALPIQTTDGRPPIKRTYINRIHLIKLFMEVSGSGLKDAKNSIEATIIEWDSNQYTIAATKIDMDKLIAIFGPYITPAIEDEDSELLKGVKNAIENWATLGFINKFAAARMVINNFQNRASLPYMASLP